MNRIECKPCNTRYPVVLIHGAGFRDLKWPESWRRIPAALQKEGAEVYYGLQDSWGTIETNARQIQERLEEILRDSGSEKVNIIAYSKGGLDIRMAVSSLGCGDKVASITTIATPHHGSKTMDWMLRFHRLLLKTAAFVINSCIRILGDQQPDFFQVCTELTTEEMNRFNEENPDVPGIYYQSVGCIMCSPRSDILLSIPYVIIHKLEGENDGMVSVESARWGNEFRLLWTDGMRGISHLDAIDFRRRSLLRETGSRWNSICDLYVEIVAGLKKQGL